MDLRERLQNKLVHLDSTQVDCILSFLNRYDITLMVKDFDQHGVILHDKLGKSIRICYLESQSGTQLYVSEPNADIAVIYSPPIPIGWIDSNKIVKTGGRNLVDSRSLNFLPEEFIFTPECAHLDVWGGFHYQKDWECANCKSRLVFFE